MANAHRKKCHSKESACSKKERPESQTSDRADVGQPKPLVINIHLRKCLPPSPPRTHTERENVDRKAIFAENMILIIGNWIFPK